MSKELRSLYIHFPFCHSHCNYCDFYSELFSSPSKLLSYQEGLLHSWKKHQALLDERAYSFAPLETLYFGGGTPSLWGQEGARFFGNFLKETGIKLASSYEWTMELNPRAFQVQDLEAWEALGLNRYSLGVQSMDSELLKKLGRAHSLEDTKAALEILKGRNYSVDLMLGLPFSEGRRELEKELEQILSYEPKHLSVYILTVEKDYEHFEALPSEEAIEKEYLFVSEYLQKKGYAHYEVSNYAKPGFEAKHNLKYWKTESVGALGPSATGLLVEGEKALRYKWDESGEDYLCEELDERALRLERFYMRFRTNLGLEPQEFFSPADSETFTRLAKDWERRGLLAKTQARFCLSAQGYLLLDSLMDQIFYSIKSL